MNDNRKPETLDLRVRFRFSKLIDPELYQLLNELSESERSSLLHAMITRSALGVAMPLNGLAQSTEVMSGVPTRQKGNTVAPSNRIAATAPVHIDGPEPRNLASAARQEVPTPPPRVLNRIWTMLASGRKREIRSTE